MKLMCELVEENLRVITEANEKGGKTYHIEGVFMQGNTKNKNGRRYPTEVLAREAERYKKNYIDENRAYGELGHPTGPTINLERVSHMIKDLRQDGDNFIGKAKIMDTPYGKIVQNLMDEGARLGVSTRGMGTLKDSRDGIMEVQPDFYLATAADIVADPSAPNAFVRGIMEGREWVWDNGIIKEAEISEMKKTVDSASRGAREAKALEVFESFLKRL
jgi:hypothetical protein